MSRDRRRRLRALGAAGLGAALTVLLMVACPEGRRPVVPDVPRPGSDGLTFPDGRLRDGPFSREATPPAARIPAGLILLWTGAETAIPPGWRVCDGTAGTPDLRGRFVLGAGGKVAVGSSGGAASHSHTSAGHQHTLHYPEVPSSQATLVGSGGQGYSDGSHGHYHKVQPPDTPSSASALTLSTDPSLPPYRALLYLCKS